MADGTSIEWTDATWTPIRARNKATGKVGWHCEHASPGCMNCYSETFNEKRLGTGLAFKPGHRGDVEHFLDEAMLIQPLRWRRPRMVFVCSMTDLFGDWVSDEWIDRVFAVMAMAPQHTFQVLTKRPERMRDYLKGHPSTIPYLGRMPLERIHLEAAGHMKGDGGFMDALKDAGSVYSLYLDAPWPLPNVWAGISAEDQRRADERVPILLDTPAAVRWVSAEPLLGPIDFKRWCPTKRWATLAATGERVQVPRFYMTRCEHCGWTGSSELLRVDHGWDDADIICPACNKSIIGDEFGGPIDWIVAGGESGPGARPMHPDWASSIRDQCAEAGVPFLFKQWGAWAPICEMSEAEVDRCYRSNRRAREGESQETLDEIYGQTRIVPSLVLHNDGSQHHNISPGAWLQGTGAMTMFAIGKKAAGRVLDGRLHDGFPGGAKDG